MLVIKERGRQISRMQDMESPNLNLWNLKEEAKWARTAQTQMQAIQQIGTFGELARPVLEEILTVSASEEIKAKCIEAMKAIDSKSTPPSPSPSAPPSNADTSEVAGSEPTPQQQQKNNNNKKNIQEEKAAKSEKEPK